MTMVAAASTNSGCDAGGGTTEQLRGTRAKRSDRDDSKAATGTMFELRDGMLLHRQRDAAATVAGTTIADAIAPNEVINLTAQQQEHSSRRE